jgi:hypothetical protein
VTNLLVIVLLAMGAWASYATMNALDRPMVFVDIEGRCTSVASPADIPGHYDCNHLPREFDTIETGRHRWQRWQR